MIPRSIRWSMWAYDKLLLAYPPGYRARFSEEMHQVFALLCRDSHADQGGAGIAALWLPTLMDLAWTAAVQWINQFKKIRGPDMQTTIRVLQKPGLLLLGVAWWGLGLRFFAGPCGPLGNILTFTACLPLGYLFVWASRKLPLAAAGTAALLTVAGLSTGFLFQLEASTNGTGCVSGLFSPYLIFTGGFFCAALLLSMAARRIFISPLTDETTDPRKNWRKAAILLLCLAILVLGKSIHTFYWLMVWDSTNDPLGFIWLIPAIVNVIFAGLLLIFTLPGRVKWGGLGFIVCVSLLLFGAANLAQRVNFHTLTTARSMRITDAIEAYHAKQGNYPVSLRQLVPWYTLSVSEPVIIATLGWCYEGGPDYYRLAYTSRNHWSDPNLFALVASSAGDVSSLPPACGKEISTYQARMSQPPSPLLGGLSLIGALTLGVFPASLVVLATLFLQRRGPIETASQRVFLFFEITAGVLLGLAALISLPSISSQYPVRLLGAFLVPTIFGLLVILIFSWNQVAGLKRTQKVLVYFLSVLILVAAIFSLRDLSTILMLLAPMAATLAGAWLLNRRPSRWVWLFAAGAFILMATFQSYVTQQGNALPRFLQTMLGFLYTAAPALSVAAAALLLVTGLRLASSAFAPPGEEFPSTGRLEGVSRVAGSFILIAWLAYGTARASIWDQTTDGLGGLMITMISIPVAIVCGMVIALKGPARRRLVGAGFAVLVPILVIVGFRYGWDVSFPQLTERRAGRIGEALERYARREGGYPARLSDLVPRDLLFVPRPVMFSEEDWCYQAKGSAYRLAAFSHEYFGTPVSLTLYQSAGSLDDHPLPCAERLAEMQARYDWTSGQTRPEPGPPATPVPLLEGQAREKLAPILTHEGQIIPGTWSPDGRYWWFRVTNDSNQYQLYLFDSEQGAVCAMPLEEPVNLQNDLPTAAWLLGNQLLYIGSQGFDLTPSVGMDESEPAVFPIYEPCGGKVGELAGVKNLTISRVLPASEASRNLLLQTETAYYLVQPGRNAAQPIPGIQPSPIGGQSDTAAWSPGGSRLAIAQLNSRNPEDGISLHIIDGDSGELTDTLKLNFLAESGLPFVEWLSDDQVLIHGYGKMISVDLATSPARQVDVPRELFHLNLIYPDQVFSMAVIHSKDGNNYHICLWVNLPHDKQMYIFHSENQQLSMYTPKSLTVLVFPDGKWERMYGWAEDTTVSDQVEILWIDSDRAPVTIPISGHQPRGYQMLDVRFLFDPSRLLLASSNGVSMVSVPSGELLHFWQTGSGRDSSPWLKLSPDGKTALLPVQWDGLFDLPLQEK
jgi:hypothetical protein